ncbi:MAG: helix-turn-helix transcriptional regulator [Oscillibacter sp.]|nr:helix-turn-helix transcriptional regulator [Oscillibacter sp.]
MAINTKKFKEKLRVRKLSVFGGHLLMMGIMLLIAIVPQVIGNRILNSTLTEYYFSELEQSVERGCERMSSSLYRTCAIPVAVQVSKYYEELAHAGEDMLPLNQPWLLSRLSVVLNDQVYLAGDSEVRLIYFPNVDSISTNTKCFVNAEDCFNRFLRFSETDAETILSLLRKHNTSTILPAQALSIDGGAARECVAMIIYPVASDISVMSVYSKDTILDYLNYGSLPEGSGLQIADRMGNVLLTAGEPQSENSYEINTKTDLLQLRIKVWVPTNYFNIFLRPAYRTSLILALGTALIGFLLCFLFADISTRRIRRLADLHPTPHRGDVNGFEGNELDYLDYIISESENKAETLQQRMRTGALIRAFSGALLSEDDEEILDQCISALGGGYRVALLELPAEVNFTLKGTVLPENLTAPFFCEEISDRESGVLMCADEENLRELKEVVTFLGKIVAQNGETVSCGISGVIDEESRFHVGLRQARIAMQSDEEIGVYSENEMKRAEGSIPWLQHQRLYRSILNRNGDEASRMIREFVQSGGVGQEAFHNTLFILRSAAEELGVEIPELNEARYDPRAQTWENIGRLDALAHMVIAAAERAEDAGENDPEQQILSYVMKNSADPGLCAASVGSHFGISEKNVYAHVRRGTGMSFREYASSIRMRKAAHLLCDTQEGIAEIAQECGYPAVSTFFRVFKNYFGCTPSQYRQTGSGRPHSQNDENEDE